MEVMTGLTVKDEEALKNSVLPELWDKAKGYYGKGPEFRRFVLFSEWIKTNYPDYKARLVYSKNVVYKNGFGIIKNLMKELKKIDDGKEIFPVMKERIKHKEFVEIVLSIFLDEFCAFLEMKNMTLKKGYLVKSSNEPLNAHTKGLLIKLQNLEKKKAQKNWICISEWTPSSNLPSNTNVPPQTPQINVKWGDDTYDLDWSNWD